MRRMLIAVFESPESAQAARSALLAQGVHDTQLAIEGGGVEDGGLAEVVARMFGGSVPQDDPRARYTDALRGGAVLLAVNALDDEGIARVSSTLLRYGAKRVDPYPDGGAGTHRGTPPADPRAGSELAAVSTVGGPQVSALPNAPTGWNRSVTTAELRAHTEDPARPKGELEDAAGLDPEADREALEARLNRR